LKADTLQVCIQLAVLQIYGIAIFSDFVQSVGLQFCQ